MPNDWSRGLCRYDYIKDFEMRRLSQIIQLRLTSHSKREAERGLTHREGDRKTEAEIGMMQ